MGLLLDVLAKFLQERAAAGVLWELLLLVVPLSVAMAVGVVAGWAWRPQWMSGPICQGDQRNETSSQPPSSTHQLPRRPEELDLVNTRLLGCPALPSEAEVGSLIDVDGGVPSARVDDVETSGPAVSSEDFEHLRRLVEGTDGGPPWLQMMERSLPTLKFRAWYRDSDVGPPQHCTRTIFEGVTPELVRDFFWDDEFRIKSKWDDMLLHHEVLEECPETGMMVVRWIRKFPFFCSDREYIIGRRIWRCGKSYYCVTKGLPYFPVPTQRKPMRVDLYYSSWYIRPVESAGGKLSACEVTFFHHEDMGIPRELVKLGARYGMWGTVKKIEPGLRAYQAAREAGRTASRYFDMARINTEVAPRHLDVPAVAAEDPLEVQGHGKEGNQPGWAMHKLLIFGGVALLAFSLDRSLLTKAAVLGVARRFPRPAR